MASTPLEPEGCVWCGGSPLTREHLLPQWLLRVLIDVSPASDGYDLAYEWTTEEATSQPRVYFMKRPELVVNAVCARCNNGWMADLEGTVQPLLEPLVRGQAIRLDVEAQTTVARWAAKTAVLVDRYAPGSVVLSPGDLDAIRLGGTAPSGFHIRLAFRPEEDVEPFNLYFNTAVASPVGSSADLHLGVEDEPNAFVVTLGLGHMAVSVVGGPGVDNPDRWALGGTLPLMCWPPTLGGITWPPLHPRLHNKLDLRDFHEGFWTRLLNPNFPRPDALRHVLADRPDPER